MVEEATCLFDQWLDSGELELVSRGQVKYLDFADYPHKAIGTLSLGRDYIVIIASVQMAIVAFVPTRASDVIAFEIGLDRKSHIQLMMEQITQHWDRGERLGYFDHLFAPAKAFVVGMLTNGQNPRPDQTTAIMNYLESLGLEPRLNFFDNPRAQNWCSRGTIIVTCPDDESEQAIVFIDGNLR